MSKTSRMQAKMTSFVNGFPMGRGVGSLTTRRVSKPGAEARHRLILDLVRYDHAWQTIYLPAEIGIATAGVVVDGTITPNNEARVREALQHARRFDRRHVLRCLGLSVRATHEELVAHLQPMLERLAAADLAEAMG